MIQARTNQQLTTIARGGSLNLLGAIISAFANFALILVVSQMMPTAQAGQVFSATSLFVVALAVVCLGTDAGLGRFTQQWLVHDKRANIEYLWRHNLIIVTTLGVIVALIATLSARSIAHSLGLSDPQAPEMLIIIAWALPFAAAATMAQSATRAMSRMGPTVVIDKIGKSVAQPVGVWIAALAGGGLVWVSAAWGTAWFFAAIASVWIMAKVARLTLESRQTLSSSERRTIQREFWSFTWPRSIAQVSQMAIQRVDIVLIAAIAGAHEAAIYTAATRFVVFGQFGVQAIQQVVQPQFARLVSEDDVETLREVFAVSTAWNILLAWPIYLAIGCVPTVYLSLFGPEYVESGVMVVVVMMIAMLFAVASGPVDTLLLMSGHSMLSLANSLTALAINIVGCFVLIPAMGIVGAAWAWCGAIVVRSALAAIQVHRVLGISALGRPVLVAVAVSVLCVVTPMSLASWWFGQSALVFAVSLTIAVIAFLAVVAALRGPLHVDVLLATISRRKKNS